MSTAETVVRSYFRCLDTEDWPGMAELWHEECELRAVGARPRLGRDDVVAYFSRLFTPWSEHRDEPLRVIVAGDVVTVEVRFHGRMASGREVTFDAVDLFDVEAGRIRRLSNWYDLVYARKVLTET
jgi:ketosteroid isomerase-like protein